MAPPSQQGDLPPFSTKPRNATLLEASNGSERPQTLNTEAPVSAFSEAGRGPKSGP
jgi:hypothetical protein